MSDPTENSSVAGPMICATCGGHVAWRGPMSNRTHTECGNCGAVDNQIPEAEGITEPDGDAGEFYDAEG